MSLVGRRMKMKRRKEKNAPFLWTLAGANGMAYPKIVSGCGGESEGLHKIPWLPGAIFMMS
jgi:hypothetical protein